MDVFIHVPKASGSTIRAVLSRQYGIEHILYYEPTSRTWNSSVSPREFLQNSLARRQIRLITGHEPIGIHSVLRQPCRYFCIIRDPIRRAISDYFYAYNYEHHRLRNEILNGSLSFEEFLLDARFGFRFAQAKMIAGESQSAGRIAETALENATFSLAALGTTERFEESILYTARVLQWDPPIYIRKNTTWLGDKVEQSRRDAEAVAFEKYRQTFEDEYIFYLGVNSLLSARISAEGPAFLRALDAFRGMQSEIEAASGTLVNEQYEFNENDRLPAFAQKYMDSEPYGIVRDYLQSSRNECGSGRNYVGRLDRVDDSLIVGWAQDLWQPDPISVTLYRGTDVIARTPCNLERPDVMQAGFGRSNVGFRISLPPSTGDMRALSVCFEDTTLLLRGG